MTGPLVRDADGDWVWRSEAITVEGTFEAPGAAVDAGIDALRAAVASGKLTREDAIDVAMDARFGLGAEEHHLGGHDSDAFEALSVFEDELREDA